MPSCNPITRENVGQVGTFHFPYAATLRLHRLNLPLRLRKHLVGVKIPDFGRHDPGQRWSLEGGRLAREATARLTTAMAAPEEIYLAVIRNLEDFFIQRRAKIDTEGERRFPSWSSSSSSVERGPTRESFALQELL